MSLFEDLVVCVSASADFGASKALNTRAKIEAMLEQHGATVVKSVTKKVRFLAPRPLIS